MKIQPGQHFRFDGFELKILSSNHLPDKVIATAKIPLSTVEIGNRVDICIPSVQVSLRKIIFNLAKVLSAELLINPAKEIAHNLDVTPSQWRVSNARRRTLGTCNSRGVVSFSPLLVFAPEDFRHYIICHELSHLRHFNHSKEFHTLCNTFCLRTTGRPESYFRRMMKEIFLDRNSLLWSLREFSVPTRGDSRNLRNR